MEVLEDTLLTSAYLNLSGPSGTAWSLIANLTHPTAGIYSVNFNHDGSLLASGSLDYSIHVYNVFGPTSNPYLVGIPDGTRMESNRKIKFKFIKLVLSLFFVFTTFINPDKPT